ncbi:twin-arginine translocase TatA/TatE family subunit [Kribbella sp. NPDC048915]|uniref:twin-arginine translocase TatA/TatE family subunit n=1 Tax=Kribbella sp. NPDC048915 TaxID=3155148 RepID=UPI0033E83B32
MVLDLALPEGGEWIVILVIVVLLFGAKKLPELTRNVARSMKEFEKARREGDSPPAQITRPAAETDEAADSQDSADRRGTAEVNSGGAQGVGQ